MASVIKLRINKAKQRGSEITIEGGQAPSAWRGNESVFHVAVFEPDGSVADLSDHSSLNLAYMPDTRTEDSIALDTASISNATFTEEQWLAGTHKHAVFTLTDTDLNPTLGGTSKSFWMVVFGLITGTGKESTHGACTFTLHEDGTANTVTPPDGPETGVTAAQVEAIVDDLVEAAVDAAIAEIVGGIVLNNFAATTNPTTGDDTGDGYAIGSTWINTSNDTVWRCTDASSGAAQWERVDQDAGTLNNYAATTDPTTGDDSGDGYSIGSVWVNTTTDAVFTCTDASSGAAVWEQTNATVTGVIKADGTVAGTAMQEFKGINLTDAAELTIASGAATATQSIHIIDTEGDASTDTLDTLTPAKGEGDIAILFPADNARVTTISEAGNFVTPDGSGLDLDNVKQGLLFIFHLSKWRLIGSVSAGGSGDVTGPGSSTDNAIARFDGTTGKVIQNSSATIDDSGAATFPAVTVNGGGNALTVTGNVSGSAFSAYPYFAIGYPTGKMSMASTSKLQWASIADYLGTIDLIVGRGGAATLQLGDDHATAPTAQRIQGPAATSGNNDGANLTIAGGAGSGTGVDGDVILDGHAVEIMGVRHLGDFLYDAMPLGSTGDVARVVDATDDSFFTGTQDYAWATKQADTYWHYDITGETVNGV